VRTKQTYLVLAALLLGVLGLLTACGDDSDTGVRTEAQFGDAEGDAVPTSVTPPPTVADGVSPSTTAGGGGNGGASETNVDEEGLPTFGCGSSPPSATSQGLTVTVTWTSGSGASLVGTANVENTSSNIVTLAHSGDGLTVLGVVSGEVVTTATGPAPATNEITSLAPGDDITLPLDVSLSLCPGESGPVTTGAVVLPITVGASTETVISTPATLP
jgi:hypothetical protein